MGEELYKEYSGMEQQRWGEDWSGGTVEHYVLTGKGIALQSQSDSQNICGRCVAFNLDFF